MNNNYVKCWVCDTTHIAYANSESFKRINCSCGFTLDCFVVHEICLIHNINFVSKTNNRYKFYIKFVSETQISLNYCLDQKETCYYLVNKNKLKDNFAAYLENKVKQLVLL